MDAEICDKTTAQAANKSDTLYSSVSVPFKECQKSKLPYMIDVTSCKAPRLYPLFDPRSGLHDFIHFMHKSGAFTKTGVPRPEPVPEEFLTSNPRIHPANESLAWPLFSSIAHILGPTPRFAERILSAPP